MCIVQCSRGKSVSGRCKDRSGRAGGSPAQAGSAVGEGRGGPCHDDRVNMTTKVVFFSSTRTKSTSVLSLRETLSTEIIYHTDSRNLQCGSVSTPFHPGRPTDGPLPSRAKKVSFSISKLKAQISQFFWQRDQNESRCGCPCVTNGTFQHTANSTLSALVSG